MLIEQEYGGHKSIHDDAEAERLGFKAGPIEGPTHFSQFDPLAGANSGAKTGSSRAASRATTRTWSSKAKRFRHL